MRASSTDKALVCPRSLVAPALLTPRTKSTEKADTGTLLHLWAETGEEHPDVAAKIIRSKARREDYWNEAEGEHEVTFAINLATLKMEQPSKRQKKDGDTWKKQFDSVKWLTGTMDWLGTVDGMDWVDDLKTGDWWVDPRTGQLLSYALVPWILKGCPEGDYKVARSITHWPWYPLHKPPQRWWASEDGISAWAGPQTHPITALDLLCHVQDLRYVVEHPEEARVVGHVYHPTKTYKDGRRALDEISPCTFCDAREPHAFSSWMQHFEYRAMPTCIPGVLSQLRKKDSK